MSNPMVLRPRMSEKAYGLSMTQNTYVFDVPKSANKITITEAVQKQFSVSVQNVTIIIAKGKPKSSYQKRNRPMTGYRSDVKKAYVRLKQGDSIAIFEVPAEEPKKAEKTVAKTEEKPAEKKGILRRSKKEEK